MPSIEGLKQMIKKLLANVGSYKKDSLLTPVYVGEGCLRCHYAPDHGHDDRPRDRKGDAGVILRDGGLLFMFLDRITFRNAWRTNGSNRLAGFARNLRHNLFRRIQDFPFQTLTAFLPPVWSPAWPLTWPTSKMRIKWLFVFWSAVR